MRGVLCSLKQLLTDICKSFNSGMSELKSSYQNRKCLEILMLFQACLPNFLAMAIEDIIQLIGSNILAMCESKLCRLYCKDVVWDHKTSVSTFGVQRMPRAPTLPVNSHSLLFSREELCEIQFICLIGSCWFEVMPQFFSDHQSFLYVR